MKTCEIKNCDKPLSARGMCIGHYGRWRKTGDANPELPLTHSKPGDLNPRWEGGKSAHPLYLIYFDMVARCSRPSHFRYEDYGGRGITVHPSWVNDFWQFVEDVGERPEGKTKGGRAFWQLDRIDNDGNYEPGNVRWATPNQQRNNTRPKRRQTHCRRGHEMTSENSYVNPNTGEVKCRECGKITERKRQEKRRREKENGAT